MLKLPSKGNLMISVAVQKIKPDLTKLKRKLHVNSPKEEAILSSVISELILKVDPKYSYKKVNFYVPPVAGLLAESKDLHGFLVKSEEGFVVICTLGNGTTDLITKYQLSGNLIAALYADRVASDFVENLAEQAAHELLDKFYSNSEFELTKRYSPGYGDLRIEKQKVLFGLFKDMDVDVTLTSANYMDPEKSISYIVGVKTKGGHHAQK